MKDAERTHRAGGGFLAEKDVTVPRDERGNLCGGVAQEFDAEVAQAHGPHLGDELRGGLGEGVVERVAAADVGNKRMGEAHAAARFAEVDAVGVAGAAAVAEVFAVGEHVGEDAVLHVEHGHVLMDDGLEAGGVAAEEHRAELLPTQVVAGDHADEAGVGEDLGGEFVGDVEGVVADLRQRGCCSR